MPVGRNRKDLKVLDLPQKMSSQEYHEGIFKALLEQDRQVYELVIREYERLCSSLQLIAAENQCSRAVLAALGSILQPMFRHSTECFS